MCCLVYEDAFYRAQRAQFPTHGKRVETDRGEGVVRDVDVLARTVRVAFPDGTQATFAVEEVRPLQQGARQGGPREPQGGERG
jgi:cell fate regulator YaaT (PSP1 superfamily)